MSRNVIIASASCSVSNAVTVISSSPTTRTLTAPLDASLRAMSLGPSSTSAAAASPAATVSSRFFTMSTPTSSGLEPPHLLFYLYQVWFQDRASSASGWRTIDLAGWPARHQRESRRSHTDVHQ